MDHHTIKKYIVIILICIPVVVVFLKGCFGPNTFRTTQTLDNACHGIGECQCPWKRYLNFGDGKNIQRKFH